MLALLVSFALASFAATGCSDSQPTAPPEIGLPPIPDIPLGSLLAAPDTFLVDGVRIHLDAFVYRNFMPTGGTVAHAAPLIVDGRLAAQDVPIFPAFVHPAYIWAIHGGEIWGANVRVAGDYPLNVARAVAVNGPPWPVGDSVDVVFGIRDSADVLHLARRVGEPIGRAD